mgnify:CR=1 FL=1
MAAKKGGGNLNERDAAQIGGSGKSGKVAHHAAAERHDEITAGDMILDQKIIDIHQHRMAFGILPMQKGEMTNAKARLLEGTNNSIQVQGGYIVIGDDGSCRFLRRKNLGRFFSPQCESSPFSIKTS